MYEYDKRVVLTLDAGGTNFVFSAIQGNNEMISPIGLPAVSDNLDECLEVLVKGFDRVLLYQFPQLRSVLLFRALLIMRMES